MNKEGWEIKRFENCLQKVVYTKKLKSNQYLPFGKYPIVSQEETLISGYWNDESDIFCVDKPIVIFGDHTRILKYVDFSFVIGADGVKILLPNEKLNTRFLYYYLLWYNVQSLGYSRHYKLLKEIDIPLPSITIQDKIVSELDVLNDIITKKKDQLAELDTLAQATFYDMFGDPVENEKGWEVKGLEEFYKDGKKAVKCGPFGSALKKDEYTSSGIPVWNMDNINGIGKFVSNVNLWISPTKYKELESYNVLNGDIIISRAGTVGKMCVVSSSYPTSIISTNLIRLRLNSGLLPLYFVKAMTMWGHKICRLKVGEDGAFTHMNTGILNSIKMAIPPLSLQNQFAKRIEAIETKKELINKSIKEVQQLFDYTMDKYFN